MEAAALGGIFLLALIASAYAGDHTFLDRVTPALGVAGLIGAVGVGALIKLLSSRVWNALFPYHSRPFRSDVARTLKVTAAVAKVAPDLDRAHQALLATSYRFHSEGGQLVEWARRRHANFASALEACVALVLGTLLSFVGTPQVNAERVVVIVAFGLVAGFAIRDGLRQRIEAETMERLWFEQHAADDAQESTRGVRPGLAR